MNWSRFFIVGSAVFVFLCMLHAATFIFRPENIDHCINAIQAFEELPNHSIDILVIGSSHAWRGVDTRKLYDQYGLRAYNYGCNWQSLSTEELFLRNALHSQSPKVVLFETFRINDTFYDVDMDGEIYYTRSMPWTSERVRYIRRAFGRDVNRYIAYLFPLSQFHSGWDVLNERNFQHEKTYTKEFLLENRGYFKVDSNEAYPISIGRYIQNEQMLLDDMATGILEKLIQDCKERDVKLIFFTVPWQGSNYYHDALVEISRKHACDYIDFFEIYPQIGLDPAKDFADAGHLTDGGAEKISDYIGKYLIENYESLDWKNSEHGK